MKRKDLITNGYKLVRTSIFRGYVSRKGDAEERSASMYSWKYGTGYTVNMPNWKSTRYSYIEYWIK